MTSLFLFLAPQDDFLSQDSDPCPCDDTDGSPPSASETNIDIDQAVAEATAFMKNSQYERAATLYSLALTGCTDARLRASLLLRRSAAYCSLSEHLRNIPAAQSEECALNAPDPIHLAACGLRDAEEALRVDAPHIASVHASRGDAFYLLERYGDATEAYRLAVAHAPGQCHYTSKVQLCENTVAKKGQGKAGPLQKGDGASGELTPSFNAVRTQALQDVECTLCLKLLYEPVTTPCGHTFCRPCFARSADHTNKCPMCRTVLHVGRELPVSVVLKNILESAFPEDYHARRVEEAALSLLLDPDPQEAHRAPQTTVLPLFVMSSVLPGECMALNIFEPRYRLMVRRVMEGGRRFGMATVDASHNLHSVACEVEIIECDPLPDGRYYLEVVGRRRFAPLDPGEQDGYRLAGACYLEDEVPEPGSSEAMELEQISSEVDSMAQRWFERMQGLGRSRRSAAEYLRRVGDKPSLVEKEKFSFWVVRFSFFLLLGFRVCFCGVYFI